MKNNTKRFSAIISSFAILVSVIATNTSFAYQVAEHQLYQWDRIHVWSPSVYEYSTNYHYRDIAFINGFSYTTSSKDTTTLADSLCYRWRTTYTRTYKTW